MRRREFITLVGGGAAAWPLAARAQQGERVRRIGVLMNTGADEPESQARLAAFILQQVTRTIPIVMAQAIDPVGNGYIDSLAQPGGNTTGFTQFEYSLAGKWMELLKEVAPGTRRVGVLREPGGAAIAAAIGQWTMIQAVAQSFG